MNLTMKMLAVTLCGRAGHSGHHARRRHRSDGRARALQLRTLPVPSVDANEVLIAVRAASVASWDIEIRQSMAYINQPKFPYTLGSDGSGVIAAVGSAVKRFKVSDEVYAYCWDNPKGGFYAEYVAVPADCVSKLPKGVSLEAAGALGASGLTALSGIDRALHIRRGESLIIHGASGAVGTLALQIAKVRGARVLATASGEEAWRWCANSARTWRSTAEPATSPWRRASSRRRESMPCSRWPVGRRWTNAWTRCAPTAAWPIRMA
jgi:NADPH:quinone reductase-like Zn-dependent oxidoreductase